MTASFSISIDSDACVGHGRCFALHPTIFAADDQGFPVLLADNYPHEQRAAAQEAVHECPERAIHIADAS